MLVRTAPVRGAGGWDKSQWNAGDVLKVSAGGHDAEHALEDQGNIPDPRNPLYPDVKTELGQMALQPGDVELTIEATKISPEAKTGIHLREVVLMPAQ